MDVQKALMNLVSIHAPTKGATVLTLIVSYTSAVSIHAPTKGATETVAIVAQQWRVSIHAPTKGATDTEMGKGGGRMFQSTLPRRERQKRHTVEPYPR